MNTYMLTQFDVLTALHREHYRTRGQIDPKVATSILQAYCRAKLQKGRSKQEVSWKLADLEAQLPNLATSFIETRRSLALPEGMYRLSRSTTSGANGHPSSSASAIHPAISQWEASDLRGDRAGMGLRRNTTSHAASSGGNQTVAFGRRPSGVSTSTPTAASRTNGTAVNRPSTTTTSGARPSAPTGEEGEDLPPPPYARDDPEPDQTRQLEIRLAGEQSRGQVDLPEAVVAAGLGGTDVAPEVEVGGGQGQGTGNAAGGSNLAAPLGQVVQPARSETSLTLALEEREARDLEEAIRLSLLAESSQSQPGPSTSSGSSSSTTMDALPPIPTRPVIDAPSSPSSPFATNFDQPAAPARPPRPTSGPFAHRRAVSDFPPMRSQSPSSHSNFAVGSSQAQMGPQVHDMMDATTEDMGKLSMPGAWERGGGSFVPMTPTRTGVTPNATGNTLSSVQAQGSYLQAAPQPLQRQDTASKNPFLQPMRASNLPAPSPGTNQTKNPFLNPPQTAPASGSGHTVYAPPGGVPPSQSNAGDIRSVSSRSIGGADTVQTPFGAPALPARKVYAPPAGPPPRDLPHHAVTTSTASPPEIAFFRSELHEALQENQEAIRSFDILDHGVGGQAAGGVVTRDGGGAGCAARIVTLDDLELVVRIQNEGYRLLSPPTAQIYDTLDSLLINHSPAYVQKVNESLTSRLNDYISASRDGPDRHRFEDVEE